MGLERRFLGRFSDYLIVRVRYMHLQSVCVGFRACDSGSGIPTPRLDRTTWNES